MNTSSANPCARLWALLPCAGNGSRSGASGPKQYAPVAGQPLVLHTLAAFAAVPRLSGVLVVVSAGDGFFAQYPNAPFLVADCGGATRAQSVLNGIGALQARGAAADDWVLVHDAARPCLSGADLAQLLDAVRADEVGGLLAVPVTDTLKRSAPDARVAKTVSRDQLWRALTPQMFRYEVLERALSQAAGQGMNVTDEAQAVELLGLQPRLVAGSADNLKITVPEDLRRAQQILAMRSDATVSPVP